MSEMNNNGEGMENIADDMLEEVAGGKRRDPRIYVRCTNPDCERSEWHTVMVCGKTCPRCNHEMEMKIE